MESSGQASVQLTGALWAPFEYYMCGMRRAQIDSILTTKLLILTRTVITAKAGHQVVILTAKAQALQHALAYLMAMPESWRRSFVTPR